MVKCLSFLTWPEHLYIIFQSYFPCPDQETRCLPPLTRVFLPVLTSLSLEGVPRTLSHLFAHIATPLLQHFEFRHSHPAIFEVWQVGFGHVARAMSRRHRKSPKFRVGTRPGRQKDYFFWHPECARSSPGGSLRKMPAVNREVED